MRNNHAFFHRTDARAWWCALALGCISLIADAAPINRNNIGQMGLTQTGRTTTLTPGAPPANSGGSTIPVSPTSGGWTAAGNYGVPPSATGPTAGLNVNGTFIQGERGNYNIGGAGGVQGVRYPVSGGYQIPWSVVAPVAAGIVCAVATAGACSIAGGVAAAAPYIIDWIAKAGGRRNPDTGQLERVPTGLGYCYSGPCYAFEGYPGTGYKRDPEEACMTFNARYGWTGNDSVHAGPTANVDGRCYQTSPYVIYTAMQRQVVAPLSPTWYPSSMDDIVPYMQKVNPDPRVWGEVLDKGGTIEFPNPTVTGPSSIQGPETVKQNADGTKEVSRTTYNFSTAGNTVTNTSNVTTNNTYNSSNVQTSSTTTTTTPSDNSPAPEEPEDACTKHPEALGCQKIDFDTPAGEIPKDTKTVTFQEESLFGSGSCPADRMVTLQSTGQTLKAWDWAQACNLMLPIRAIVMTLATFAAFLIVMPGMGGKSS